MASDYSASYISCLAVKAAMIQAFEPHLGPRIAELVEKTYERLLSFDATARYFVPRQHGYAASIPAAVDLVLSSGAFGGIVFLGLPTPGLGQHELR